METIVNVTTQLSHPISKSPLSNIWPLINETSLLYKTAYVALLGINNWCSHNSYIPILIFICSVHPLDLLHRWHKIMHE